MKRLRWQRGFRGLRAVLGHRAVPALTAAVAVVIASASVVASWSVPGHPVPGMTPTDLSKLRVGPYPSAPTEFTPFYSTVHDAYAVESRRMLTFLAGPDTIDPDVRFLGGAQVLSSSSGSFDDADGPFPKNWQPIAERNRLIAGAYTWRNNDSVRARKHITLAILRFPTEQTARAAADGFNDTLDAPGRHRIPIDTSDLAADSRESVRASSRADDRGELVAAHGVYVIVGHAVIPQNDPAALGGRLREMLRAQLTAMAELKPTPLEDIPDLPTNPDGILGLTLPNQYDSADSDPPGMGRGGIYTPAGALHYERDAVTARAAFEAAGVDLVARNGATVYRTRDLAAAFGLQTALTRLGRDDDEVPNPAGITDAHCIRLDEPEPIRRAEYLCAVVYGRYVAVIGAQARFSGGAPASFEQRVSAQYSMLARSG
ncbi:DUF7373 family lipoprotein [Nocardia tengchongensis]